MSKQAKLGYDKFVELYVVNEKLYACVSEQLNHTSLGSSCILLICEFVADGGCERRDGNLTKDIPEKFLPSPRFSLNEETPQARDKLSARCDILGHSRVG